eukprot:6126953-Pleurochrysis_carterae.AAC.1
MGGTIVDKSCPTVARLALYPPCDISSSFMPQLPNPYYDIISATRSTRNCDMAIPFMASHIERILGGRVVRVMSLYVWGSLIPSAPLRAYHHV